MAQLVKYPPAIQETQILSLSQEDLEEKIATRSSILAWEIPWTEESDGLQSMESQRIGYDWATEHAHTGFPWWLSGKESTCQCRRHGFDP